MRRRSLAAVALAGAVLAVGVPAVAKRAGPRPVVPVVIGDVRFDAPPWSKAAGHGQNGGIVVARDARTGAELWAVQVYAIAYDPDLEADVQDVFIVALEPSPDGKALLVVDERGRHWRVDLASHVASADTAP